MVPVFLRESVFKKGQKREGKLDRTLRSEEGEGGVVPDVRAAIPSSLWSPHAGTEEKCKEKGVARDETLWTDQLSHPGDRQSRQNVAESLKIDKADIQDTFQLKIV